LRRPFGCSRARAHGASPDIDHLTEKKDMVLRSSLRKRTKDTTIIGNLLAWTIFAAVLVAIVSLAIATLLPPDPSGTGLSP
jgi:hypothetical protein